MRIVLIATLIVLSAFGYRTTMMRNSALLPVAFEHLDHTAEACTTCHHNYVDDTGYDSCYSCHKHDPTVALEIESMFHDLCRDCHIKKAQQGQPSGPLRVCVECHHEGGRRSQNLKLRKS